MEEDIYGFRVDFEVDSGKSFLVLTEDGLSRPEIVGFQVEMIAKNKIPGVAGLNVREKDLEIRFCYDISGLISLANFLKRKKVTKTDFIRILQNITGTLTGCKKFLLNDKCFVISENLIFINPESLEVYLIYIPCRSDADIVDIFKSFVVNLVVKTANIETDDNFVQKLLGLIKEEHLCISEFNTAIRKAEGTSPSDEALLKCQGSGRQELDGPVVPETHQATETHQVKETLSLVNRKKALNYISAVLIVLTVLTAVAVKLGGVLADINVVSDTAGPFWSIGFVVSITILFAGSAMYVIFKKKGIDVGQTDPIITELNTNQQMITELNTDQKVTARNMKDTGRNEINPANVDETVILSSQQQPVLVGSGEEAPIVISKAEFVIGRNLDTCDYAIHNKSIGRAHARIQNDGGKFFLYDLDSKNGTFLNGDRLISNKQYELKPNDRVAFANLQFCFKIE